MLSTFIHSYQVKKNEWKARLLSLPWLSMILFGGILFRLQGLIYGYFWYGEVFSVAITRFDLFTMIQKLQVNISPPLWEILLWFTPRLPGMGDINLRFWPCLFSIMTLLLVYKICNLLHLSYRQKVFCLSMLAFLPYQAWIARDTRIYALYTLLYTLSILWLLQKKWAGLSASIGLLLWCHNTAILYAFSIGILSLGMYPKEWKKIFLCFGFSLASLLPWLPALSHQTDNWVPFFDPLTFTVILDTFLIILYAWSLPVWPQMFAIAALTISVVTPNLTASIQWILKDMRKQVADGSSFFLHIRNWISAYVWPQHPPASGAEAQHFTAMLVMIPLSLFMIAGLMGKNAIIYRTFSAMIIPLFLWFALSGIPEKLRWYHKLTISLWTLSLLISLIAWKSDAQGGNINDIVSYFKTHTQRGDVLFHATGTTAVLFNYYLPEKSHVVIDEEHVFAEDAKLIYPEMSQAALEDISYKRVWIIWSKEQLIAKMNPKMVNRLTTYTAGCIYMGSVKYPHLYPTDIYLCEKAHGSPSTH